jgi:uncharacterized protein HemY
VQLADAQRQTGNPAAARRSLRRAIADDPGSRDAWLALAALQEGTPELPRLLARVRKLDPRGDLRAFDEDSR